ncbi:MAG: Tm-1-like ATP-binding domain-containing protein, partial [Hyphomicrobiaceae bacterium]
PLRGFSIYDRVGGVFHAPGNDRAFMDEAERVLGSHGEVLCLDAHINDPVCAETAVARLLAMLRADGRIVGAA